LKRKVLKLKADSNNSGRTGEANQQPTTPFDAMVLGVAHNEFRKLNLDGLRKYNSVLYDVKGVLEGNVDGKL